MREYITNRFNYYSSTLAIVVALSLLGFNQSSYAEPAVQPIILTNTAYVDVQEQGSDGLTQTVRKVVVDHVEEGQLIYYVNTVTNTTSSQMTSQLVIENPIPAHTLLDNAWGENTRILYSIDGNSPFKELAQLQRIIDGIPQPATLADVKAIRWILTELAANSSLEVGFTVRASLDK